MVQFGFRSFRHSKTRFGLRDCWMLPDLMTRHVNTEFHLFCRERSCWWVNGHLLSFKVVVSSHGFSLFVPYCDLAAWWMSFIRLLPHMTTAVKNWHIVDIRFSLRFAYDIIVTLQHHIIVWTTPILCFHQELCTFLFLHKSNFSSCFWGLFCQSLIWKAAHCSRTQNKAVVVINVWWRTISHHQRGNIRSSLCRRWPPP